MAASVTWFGAINAAREIVKEVPIFRRERLAGLKALPYLMSKVTVLGLLLRGPGNALLSRHPLQDRHPLGRGYPARAGRGLRDANPHLVRLAGPGPPDPRPCLPNPDRAQSLVPIILIPQLIFARVGSDVSLRSGTGRPWLISRWAFQAMGATGNIQSGDFGHSTELYRRPLLGGPGADQRRSAGGHWRAPLAQEVVGLRQ